MKEDQFSSANSPTKHKSNDNNSNQNSEQKEDQGGAIAVGRWKFCLNAKVVEESQNWELIWIGRLP